MPGAGTDKTKRWRAGPAPVVVLVEPQLGENIGAAAGADRVLDEAVLFDDLPAALADCSFVLATTARAHDQAKRVIGAAAAAHEIAPRVEAGETVAIMFGRERNGLENDEVADRKS